MMEARQRHILLIAGVIALLCVAFGAFAAHALKDILHGAARHQYDLGVRYAFLHALAMMIAALARPISRHHGRIDLAAHFFLAGIILFSGSLLLLSLTGIHYFAFLTPLGGISWLIAWSFFIYSMRD